MAEESSSPQKSITSLDKSNKTKEINKENKEEESKIEEDEETVKKEIDDVEENNDDNVFRSDSHRSWRSLIKGSWFIKFECFIFTLVMSFFIFSFVTLLLEKDFGFLQFLVKSTSCNHFFLLIVLGRIIATMTTFFGLPVHNFIMFAFTCLGFITWISLLYLCKLMFPVMTSLYYSNDNVLISPPVSVKISILAILLISQCFSLCLASSLHATFNWFYKKKENINLTEEKGINNRYWKMLKQQVIGDIVSNLLLWFLLIMVILISSPSNIPSLDPNVEIFIFGYAFPVVKASVVTICTSYCQWAGKKEKWSSEYTSKITSVLAAAAVQVSTLPQIYVVFRVASDPYLFLSQYLPHEIIKKLSWLAFHPLYLKIKLQVKKILFSVCKKKDKVNPKMEKKERRLTMEVFESLASVAGDIMGRQVGEDVCMILIAIWMLPLTQQYIFPDIYPSSPSPSLPFPSYKDIGLMIIFAAYGTETILTIACFAMLQHVNIPLQSNKQVMEIHLWSYLCYITWLTALILALTAATVY